MAATAATALAAVAGLADAAITWSVDHPPYAKLSNVPYAPLAAATAVSASDAWAVGRDDGSMLAEHWNGQKWSSVDVPSAPCAVFESSGTAAYGRRCRFRQGSHTQPWTM